MCVLSTSTNAILVQLSLLEPKTRLGYLEHVLVTSCPGLLEVLKMTVVEDQPINIMSSTIQTIQKPSFRIVSTFVGRFRFYLYISNSWICSGFFDQFSLVFLLGLISSVSPKPDRQSNRNTSRTLPHHPMNLPTSQNKTDSFQPQVICYLFFRSAIQWVMNSSVISK